MSAFQVVDDDNSGTVRYREFVNLMLIEEKILTKPIEGEDFRGNPPAKLKAKLGALKKKKRG